MTRIILINPSTPYAKGVNEATITPPLGLAYMAAVLEKNEHEVQIIDANILGIGSAKIPGNFKFKPDLIGISTNIINYESAVECAKYVKSIYRDTPVIIGGPHGSSLPEHILNSNAYVDAVVVGEGENTLLEIADSLGKKPLFSGIKGLVWRDNGRIIKNDPRPLIENLDEIPFPAYHKLPDLRRYKTRSRARPVGYVITSRGCSYQCTFCNKNIFGNVWRPHSVKRVIDEIAYLVERYGIRQIDILDDNFTFDRKRAEEILDCLIQRNFKLKINLQNGIRIDRTDKDLLSKMKKAGVFRIAFGVESANPAVQQRAKKVIDLNRAIELTRIARSYGIVTYGFFIIGLPGESAESIKETIDFAIKMNPHFATFEICIPFPGTEILLDARKNGFLLKEVDDGVESGYFGSEVFFKTGSIEPHEMIVYFKVAYKRFYSRLSKIVDILSTIKSIGELKWFLGVIKETFKSAKRRECVPKQ